MQILKNGARDQGSSTVQTKRRLLHYPRHASHAWLHFRDCGDRTRSCSRRISHLLRDDVMRAPFQQHPFSVR